MPEAAPTAAILILAERLLPTFVKPCPIPKAPPPVN
jgi:hypothetical protein